ncbi:MAG: hypothetical protein LUD27_05670 [Clostridia bacterium]|nr:hypothetical protein [Clostridia bacterium]
MSKKKKQVKETTIEDFYDLKTEQMDELVAALKGEVDVANTPPVTRDIEEITGQAPVDNRGKKKKSKKGKEFDPYSVDGLSRLPTWLKAIFWKFWANGAVCYFIVWGFGYYLDTTDLLVVTGIIMGVVTDVLLNAAFMHFQSDDKEFNPYMMFPFPFKKFWTFFANIVYAILIMFGVNGIYYAFNEFLNINVSLEPLLFGVFYLVVDMACIGIKDLIVFLVKRHKRKKTEIAENA